MYIGTKIALCALLTGAAAGAVAADGALDAAFGAGGKVQLGPIVGNSSGSPVANDVAIQPDGKTILVGYETFTGRSGSVEDWRLTRLNVDGTLDSSFAGDGTTYINGDATPTRAQAVAVRTDGRIVVGGSITGGSYTVALIYQLLANGSDDPAFNTGHPLALTPANSGDSIFISRIVIDSDGSIDVAGTYYNNQSGFNSNEFYFARISADGSTVEPFQYLFGSGPNADDHATDLAIDSQGRYVVAGYHRGASGNYDFAAIRIRSDLYDVDNTFGNAGQTTVDFGDNGDYANAVALTPTGYIALGGQANGQAALALLDPDGNLNQYFSSGLLYSDKFTFAFGNGGGNDTIAKLILDRYDTKYPQLLALGSGNQSGVPYGLMFGIARLNLPGTYSNFSLDSGFNGNGSEGVYFAERLDGLGALTTTDHGRSAAFANGKLVVAGDTLVSGGTDLAVARLAAFDGIFSNGFDDPSL